MEKNISACNDLTTRCAAKLISCTDLNVFNNLLVTAFANTPEMNAEGTSLCMEVANIAKRIVGGEKPSEKLEEDLNNIFEKMLAFSRKAFNGGKENVVYNSSAN